MHHNKLHNKVAECWKEFGKSRVKGYTLYRFFLHVSFCIHQNHYTEGPCTLNLCVSLCLFTKQIYFLSQIWERGNWSYAVMHMLDSWVLWTFQAAVGAYSLWAAHLWTPRQALSSCALLPRSVVQSLFVACAVPHCCSAVSSMDVLW